MLPEIIRGREVESIKPAPSLVVRASGQERAGTLDG